MTYYLVMAVRKWEDVLPENAALGGLPVQLRRPTPCCVGVVLVYTDYDEAVANSNGRQVSAVFTSEEV